MQMETFLKPLSVSGKSIKILLNRVIGPAVFIWLTWSICRQVMQQPNLSESIGYIRASVYGPLCWKFWTAILLSVVNWLTEARKWQVLMMPLQKLSLLTAFKATLAGVAFAVNTPNRIGEYGGRMLYVKKEHRIHSIALTMIGSASQLLVTLIAGVIGLMYLNDYFITIAAPYIDEELVWLGVYVIAALTIAGMVLYFRLRWVTALFYRIGIPEKWQRYINVILDIPVSFLLRVLLLSSFRYVVFVCQYILLLQAMQIEIPVVEAYWLISILYLILALIPTVTLLELGVRGKTGIVLLQGFSSNTIGIYTGGMAVWFINLIIPALVGSFLAAGLKLFNTKQ